MTHIETTKQALAALSVAADYLWEVDTDHARTTATTCDEAIKALRAAIAHLDNDTQKRLEALIDANEKLQEHLNKRAAIEQGEGKPVAWIVPDFGFLFPTNGAALSYLKNIDSNVQPTPLYAAPVSYVPLSDEQIDAFADTYTSNFPTGGLNYNKFARAIEQAVRGGK